MIIHAGNFEPEALPCARATVGGLGGDKTEPPQIEMGTGPPDLV
jgi:hypothetical protein